jgi:hypothetical protein
MRNAWLQDLDDNRLCEQVYSAVFCEECNFAAVRIQHLNFEVCMGKARSKK